MNIALLAIGPLHVTGAEAHQSPLVVGGPSMTAYTGAAHHIVRLLREHCPGIKDRGTMVFVKGIDQRVARVRTRGRDGSILLDSWPIALEWGLVLALEMPPSELSFEEQFAGTLGNALNSFLWTGRALGGTIQPIPSKFRPFHVFGTSDWSKYIRGRFHGFWLLGIPNTANGDENQKIGLPPIPPKPMEDLNALGLQDDPIIDVLWPLIMKKFSDEKTNEKAAYIRAFEVPGILWPSGIGWAFTQKNPTPQIGRHGETMMHVHAEPIIGLVGAIRAHRFFPHHENGPWFWSHHHDDTNGQLTVKPDFYLNNPTY